jgi:hypothetical protein
VSDAVEDLFGPRDGADPLDDDFEIPQRETSGKRERVLKRAKVKYARVFLPWLTDPAWWDVYPAKTRLWLYLLILSKEGAREISLTNAMAEAIGVLRKHKHKLLRQLMVEGRILLEREGRQTYKITVNFIETEP